MEFGTFPTLPGRFGIQGSGTERARPRSTAHKKPSGVPDSPTGWRPQWPKVCFSRKQVVSFLVIIVPSQSWGTQPGPSVLGLAAEPNQRQLLGLGPCWPWPALSASSESSPACSLRSDLESQVSAAIRACNWKTQDDSIWENSVFTKTQAVLRNHPEIHAWSNVSFVSEPSLGGWGLGSRGHEENTVFLYFFYSWM